jgi:predicted DNA-binding protein with PD1-like motif
MKHRPLDPADHRRSVLVFEPGDEVIEQLRSWATTQGLEAGAFTGIGAFSRVTLGYFDVDRREYVPTEIDEQVEVLSLVGNIALSDGGPSVHAHVVVGKRDGSAHGGHLLKGTVRPTLEVVLERPAPPLRRRRDDATGLALLDPHASGR